MKLAVIDNENEVRKGIVLMLQHNFPEAEIVEADGVTAGLKLIATEHPDLVFLDVEMNDGTGLDLLRKLEHRSFEVIFICAFISCTIGLLMTFLVKTPAKKPVKREALSLDRFILMKGIPAGVDSRQDAGPT